MRAFLTRMAGKYAAGSSDQGDNFKGVSAQLAALRARPELSNHHRWMRHGKRSALTNAILRMRGARGATRPTN